MNNRPIRASMLGALKFTSVPALIALTLTFNGCATTNSHEAISVNDPLLAAPPEVAALVEEHSGVNRREGHQNSDSLLAERTESISGVTPALLPTIPVEPPCCPAIEVTEEETLIEKQFEEECQAALEELKVETQRKTGELERQLEKLKLSLANNSDTMSTMKVELNNSENEVRRLADRVDFYRDEVKRLEHLMHSQHAADLVLLDSLTQQVDGLLLRASESLSQ